MDFSNVNADIDRIQYVAIFGSLIFFIFILELIRKRRIKEAYSLLWLLFGLAFIILSIFRNLLNKISWFLGIAYPPAALFLVSIVAFLFILIQFSVVISNQNDKIKELSQELGLLKLKLNKSRPKK
jgi:hypothetical protein